MLATVKPYLSIRLAQNVFLVLGQKNIYKLEFESFFSGKLLPVTIKSLRFKPIEQTRFSDNTIFRLYFRDNKNPQVQTMWTETYGSVLFHLHLNVILNVFLNTFVEHDMCFCGLWMIWNIFYQKPPLAPCLHWDLDWEFVQNSIIHF